MVELDMLPVVRAGSAWCICRDAVVGVPALIDGKSAGCGLLGELGGNVRHCLLQGSGIDAATGEGLPADLVGSGSEEFFVAHDGLDAVLQGGDRGVQFLAHALQVKELVDDAFQGWVAHVGYLLLLG